MKIRGFRVICLSMILAVLAFSPGCKKNNDNTSFSAASNYVLSSLADSAQGQIANFTYDNNGNLTMFYGGTTSYTFYYSGNKLIKRAYMNSGTLANVDSFFYNGLNQLAEIVDYDATLTKVKTTDFEFNAANQVNSATVTYVSGTNNELYLYTYTNGLLTQRNDYVSVAGDFKQTNQYTFLTYDNHPNPLVPLSHLYLPDVFSFFFFVIAWPDNVTAVEQINYDSATGNITNASSVTAIYSYNSNGLPTTALFSQGLTNLVYKFTYQQK